MVWLDLNQGGAFLCFDTHNLKHNPRFGEESPKIGHEPQVFGPQFTLYPYVNT